MDTDGGFVREAGPASSAPDLPAASSSRAQGEEWRQAPRAESEREHAEARASGCASCSSLSFNQDWLAAFGVPLCNSCRMNEKLISKARGKGDGMAAWLSLVPRPGILASWCSHCKTRGKLRQHHARRLQSSARAQFMLSDNDLSKLGSLRRKNPNHKDWQPMQLYMLSQVR